MQLSMLTVLDVVCHYLNARDLANIASTCAQLRDSVRQITVDRRSDVTRGQERLHVPVVYIESTAPV